MYHEPKQKRYVLHNPSIKRSLEIAKKYHYRVEIIRVPIGRAFLSMSEPFYKSPYPYHFTSAIRTANYVEAAYDKYW